MLLWFLTATATSSSAADTDFAAEALPLVRTYCIDCHSGDQPEAGINLEQMAAARDFGAGFKAWEKAVGMLRQQKMPPESMPQPSRRERETIINSIEGELDRFIMKNAGDPGPIVMRRLTGAEYAYTIQDLTGLDLPVQRDFVNDAVGGEGFANVGQVQFIQDSTLERYLRAARTVASHAVLGSGPLDFFEDPGATGLELSAIRRIQRIYRQHGFRTGAGEGAEPFGLDLYPRAFYVAWKYQHRRAHGLDDAILAQLAEDEQVSVRFAEHIWTVLNESTASFPTSAIIEQWRALPEPDGIGEELHSRVRAGCDGVYALMRNWQSTLAASTSDEEEAAVLTPETLQIESAHRFEARLDWPKGATTARVEIAVNPATRDAVGRSVVLWKDPRIRFRRSDRRWLSSRPLAEAITDESRQRLAFGRHPRGASLGADDFALVAPASVFVELKIPDSAIAAELAVETQLDLRRTAGTPVRCTISDGLVEGETAAESGGHSALLADPNAASYESWEQGVVEFAQKLPEVSHREPAPSDRDPIPAPFDNTYNGAERNLFHYRIKYHRDDDFLVRHVLDDPTRRRLDQAWTDLLSSFEYHDACLRFVADKYDVDLEGRGIADLDRDWIAAFPEEPRRFVEQLQESDLSIRQSLRAAEPGHVEDAIRFADRAWRRSLSEEEQSRLRAFYESLRGDEGLDHAEALRAMLARILVAPHFLYRIEPPLVEQRGIVPLSDSQLANRLSYFLWSSAPDAELRHDAETGRLRAPQALEKHARRMLRDPKARRFASEFFGQWFGFYRFDEYHGIDARRFPEFTSSLKAAMHDEAVSFFEHIVREDCPVREILFADYSFLNSELAQHYAIGGETLSGERLSRVDNLSGYHRGGLLRLGAVLTVTSAPLRTSPVKRGDWILRRVLGTPVPPPPPDAGSISADDVLADGRTVRERLEAHRRDSSCNNCHSRMDPLGFAMEHFDPVGRWRDRYSDGQAIDSTDTLGDGTTISGPEGLQQYLREHQRKFHRTLCTKLLGYALGRSEIASDRPLIEQMMADLEQDGRLSSLIVRIVTSPQFRHRRGAGEGEALSSRLGSAQHKEPDHDER